MSRTCAFPHIRGVATGSPSRPGQQSWTQASRGICLISVKIHFTALSSWPIQWRKKPVPWQGSQRGVTVTCWWPGRHHPVSEHGLIPGSICPGNHRIWPDHAQFALSNPVWAHCVIWPGLHQAQSGPHSGPVQDGSGVALALKGPTMGLGRGHYLG